MDKMLLNLRCPLSRGPPSAKKLPFYIVFAYCGLLNTRFTDLDTSWSGMNAYQTSESRDVRNLQKCLVPDLHLRIFNFVNDH